MRGFARGSAAVRQTMIRQTATAQKRSKKQKKEKKLLGAALRVDRSFGPVKKENDKTALSAVSHFVII
jgi:hypothetical protein